VTGRKVYSAVSMCMATIYICCRA